VKKVVSACEDDLEGKNHKVTMEERRDKKRRFSEFPMCAGGEVGRASLI